MCMMWSWYMANEMQFYIMAALLLAFARRLVHHIILNVLSI